MAKPGIDYSELVTSNKRPENPADHTALRKLMAESWEKTRDFCHNSPQQIRKWQLDKIIQIVNHAFRTVPLYGEKYASAGFEPGDLKTWEDFENLPILTKDELIAGFPHGTISKNHYPPEFTTRSSGSSGTFVTLAVSPDAIYQDTIQGARQFYFQSGGKYGPDDLALFIYTSPWWVSSIDGKFKTEFLPTTTSIDDALRSIERLKPKVLSVYPTYLLKLCENKANFKKDGVELIIVHSEQTTQSMRDSISNNLGIPVLDEFSSEELTRIALQCPDRRYHLEEDACYIEIVDQDTKNPLPCGERGLLIGTNLLNMATPIIRYSQGDLASLVETADCACGSNFRMMDMPFGRVMDSIVTTSGEIIPASCFMDLAYNWYLELDVPVHGLHYQIIQEQDKSIKIYLVPGGYGLTPSQIRRITNSLYQLVPGDMKIDTSIVDEIPEQKGIKYRPIISHFVR